MVYDESLTPRWIEEQYPKKDNVEYEGTKVEHQGRLFN